jgi:hypothetical protein
MIPRSREWVWSLAGRSPVLDEHGRGVSGSFFFSGNLAFWISSRSTNITY